MDEQIVKPTGWVVDMRHYTDDATGNCPRRSLKRVVSLAVFFGAIVAWVTDHLPEGDEHTNVLAGGAQAVAGVEATS
jgi:hypothetical protein